MSNSLNILDEEGMEKEEVSVSEFSELKNDVHHMKEDVSEMKDNNKGTSQAIQSISVSLATLTAHVEQNQRLGPRVEAVEKRVDKFDLKIAAAVGAASIIAFLVDLEKVKSFFM